MVNPKVQDLPPPGGYSKIPFVRVPAKTLFSGYQWIAGYIGKKKIFLSTFKSIN